MYSKFYLLLQIRLGNSFSYQCLHASICYQESLLGACFIYVFPHLPHILKTIFKSPLHVVIYYLSSAVLFNTLKMFWNTACAQATLQNSAIYSSEDLSPRNLAFPPNTLALVIQGHSQYRYT